MFATCAHHRRVQHSFGCEGKRDPNRRLARLTSNVPSDPEERYPSPPVSSKTAFSSTLSEAMVARLRAKPGGDQIPVAIGDFSELPVDGSFSLVFVVASTFYQLQSQEAQIRCVENVARRLQPGGVFVVDAFMLDAARFLGNQGMRIAGVDSDQLEVWFMQLDPAEQRLLCQRVTFTERETRLVPIPFRYAWPSELDLMARLAGLRLRERAGGWRGEPFIVTSHRHISIYELPA
ncbi:MAG: methyltransferase domain-containing protein [Egibacteraceae bacterium]